MHTYTHIYHFINIIYIHIWNMGHNGELERGGGRRVDYMQKWKKGSLITFFDAPREGTSVFGLKKYCIILKYIHAYAHT